jgi:hypothetical protein
VLPETLPVNEKDAETLLVDAPVIVVSALVELMLHV